MKPNTPRSNSPKLSSSWMKQPNGMINSPKGYSATGIHAGFRRNSSRLDLASLYTEKPARAAAMFTRNQFCGSHIQITRNALKHSGGLVQGLVCNSGQANTGTGRRGLELAKETQTLFQEKMAIAEQNQVAVFSTGIIGVLPNIDYMRKGIQKSKLSPSPKAGGDFSRAILTTDQVTKTSCYTMEIDGKKVTLAGNAKGSGMVHPNMATMLAFITTDAEVELPALQNLLRQCVGRSFHCISVDGDTSTNDSIIILANGMAGNHSLQPQHPDWNTFASALQALCLDLAWAIVRDAEGAHKFITIEVLGAPSEEQAAFYAKGVISSNLFKAAMYGEDMNWGRISSALGAVGSGATMDSLAQNIEPINFDKLDITAGKDKKAIVLMRAGELQEYSEDEAASLLSQPEIYFAIDLHSGTESARAWGCDLSYDYIHINAAKRS